MRKTDRAFELLISQRDQLVESLDKVNSTFQKTILALLTGLVSIVAANSIKNLLDKTLLLLLFQVMIMLIFFIVALLISGNSKRYYIRAIDDYVWEEYGISTLFYEGKPGRDHAIGTKSLFPFLTACCGVIVAILFLWLTVELDLFKSLSVKEIGDIVYIVLLVVEFAVLLIVVIYNTKDKYRDPLVYTDCINYLRREKDVKSVQQEHFAHVNDKE